MIYAKSRIDEKGWLRCGKCSHTLGKIMKYGDMMIEIKCHSCKTLNVCEGRKNDAGKGPRRNRERN